ncbi:MAG: sodium/proline symporter PutP [Pseudomonadota bacterium]
MQSATWFSLGLYFALMIGIGFYAWRKANATAQGYMLGGRDLGAGVTALSAGASDMSGWLLMGLPGAVYSGGLAAAWIGIGLTIGAYMNYRIVGPRLRTYTELANDAITIPDFLEERFGDTSKLLRVAAAAVIIVFFTLYCSAGMVAGGKFAVAALGMDYLNGVALAAGVVVLYVLFGGFLAVSLTDFVQGCIMFVGLVLVPIIAIGAIGGWGAIGAGLAVTEASRGLAAGTLTNWLTGTSIIGIISAAAWGLGYFGQPHIIVRFMAIRRVQDLRVARRINIGWMAISLAGAIATGLIGAIWVAQGHGRITDPETIFILFANTLFHPLITGFLLAAILAAIMSTISSQLLVTASSLAEDIWRGVIRPGASEGSVVGIGRASVVLVAGVSALLAMDPDSSILSLVSNAWAGFGAAFGPVIIASLWWRSATRWGALAGMGVGAAVVIMWIMMGWSEAMYEIVPGFAAASIAIWAVSKVTERPDADHLTLFGRAADAVR